MMMALNSLNSMKVMTRSGSDPPPRSRPHENMISSARHSFPHLLIFPEVQSGGGCYFFFFLGGGSFALLALVITILRVMVQWWVIVQHSSLLPPKSAITEPWQQYRSHFWTRCQPIIPSLAPVTVLQLALIPNLSIWGGNLVYSSKPGGVFAVQQCKRPPGVEDKVPPYLLANSES